LLLAMGFMVYRSMRLSARVVAAEQNLKQVSTGMELYFRQFNSYPPEGSDLVAELSPFVEDPEIFHNPLMEEETPGETINLLYRQPTVEEVDSPDNYVTAMVADNGNTVVVLKTGHKVVRHDDVQFSPSDPSTVVDVFDPEPLPDEDEGEGEEDGETEEEDESGFEEEDGGGVTTQECGDLYVECVGSQFGYADGTLVDIVVDANLGSGWFDIYGGQPVSGGELFQQQAVAAGTTLNVKGEIASAYERWLWSCYGYPLSYTSDDGSCQVETLLDGDTPLCLEPGFPCQVSVGELLEPYVDPQTSDIVLASNEALFLWDFNPLHTEYGIDFQDLIVCATTEAIAESECEAASEPPEDEDGDPVAYVVVRDASNTVKFEDAPTGLGEDGADETDTFRITVTGGGSSVQVTTKAGRGQDSYTLDLDEVASVMDSLGFRVTLESNESGTYTLSVTSEDNDHALSHIQFDFLDGEVVTVESMTRRSNDD
ncbi:MAG: hypothetical protein ACODAJ_12140, partial [Planctomycetota bacterium]